MGKINITNLKKTIYYLKRNGAKATWYALRERLAPAVAYTFQPAPQRELEVQRKWSADKRLRFSILVPAYRTDQQYLRELIQSVAEQSYPHWELLLADATEDHCVRRAVEQVVRQLGFEEAEGVWRKGTGRLYYLKLPCNGGISANTNQALAHVTGDYVGLLDHDDLLTADALYEMAFCIEEAGAQGRELRLLYSDEDKCSGDGKHFYEPHRKEDFNFDLLLSNNYICHFLVMKREMIQELGLRPAYDGAQDYDLVLRAVGKLLAEGRTCADKGSGLSQIVHIPKVLYHWRCHAGSTAENPQSKQYAYEAGLRALQDFADSQKLGAKAVHLKHLGFYRLEYSGGILESRSDLGAVGGRVLGIQDRSVSEQDGPTALFSAHRKAPAMVRGSIGRVLLSGRMSSEGDVYYEGLPAGFSGPGNRAVLTQTAEAVDIRCIRVRRECRNLFEQVVGVPYREAETSNHQLLFDVSGLPEEADYRDLSLKFCRALGEAGYGICYDPGMEVIWKEDCGHA